jgi:hypothetical protein
MANAMGRMNKVSNDSISNVIVSNVRYGTILNVWDSLQTAQNLRLELFGSAVKAAKKQLIQ